MASHHLPALCALALLSACSQHSAPKPDPEAVERKMIGLQANFDKFDTDGDGYLTHAELKQGLIDSGIKDCSDQRVRTIISFYDFDTDGRIALREAQSGAVTGPDALIEKLS